MRSASRWHWLGLAAFGTVVWLYNSSGKAPAPVLRVGPRPAGTIVPAAGLGPNDVPAVDRVVLEKLRLLELHYGIDDENTDTLKQEASTPSGAREPYTVESDSPPAVYAIPEPLSPSRYVEPPIRIPAVELDSVTCSEKGGAPCSFLVPAWLGEQETKAQQHLYQLGLVAMSLNRTLVLPNVARSRLGTCYSRSFSFYYDPSSLENLGIRTITQSEFMDWVDKRDIAPTAQVVTLVSPKVDYPSGAIEIDSASNPALVPNKPDRKLCLRAPKVRLEFSGHSPLSIFPPEGWHKSEDKRMAFGESLVNTLRSGDVVTRSSRSEGTPSSPDVLAFNYELRFPMMRPSTVSGFVPELEEPLPFSHFPYSPAWAEAARQISDRLSPFVAIHWRTETLKAANLVPCATALIRKLSQLKAAHPSLQAVYLATDYPIESLDPPASGIDIPHSGTFAKVVTEQHHKAMKKVLRDFDQQLRGLKLTTFAKEQGSLSIPELTDMLPDDGAGATDDEAASVSSGLEDLDPGLIGIIDKAVAMRAEIFLTGLSGTEPNVCSKISSFTRQIIGSRTDAREAQSRDMADATESDAQGTLWNDVSHWTSDGNGEE